MRTSADPSLLSTCLCHVSSGRHKIPATLPNLHQGGKEDPKKAQPISPVIPLPTFSATMKFLLLCTLVVASRAEIAEEDDVLVLKKSNFDEALKAHPNILVEFCE